jgi:hypothetical protein
LTSPPDLESDWWKRPLRSFFGLVPQLPLRHGSIGVRGLLLAGTLRRGGVILGGLVAPLAEALREFLDLAAFGGAVAGPSMNRT